MKNKLNQSLGSLTAHTLIENGLQFDTTCGKFQLLIYSDSIIRLRIVQEEFDEKDFSYAVMTIP